MQLAEVSISNAWEQVRDGTIECPNRRRLHANVDRIARSMRALAARPMVPAYISWAKRPPGDECKLMGGPGSADLWSKPKSLILFTIWFTRLLLDDHPAIHNKLCPNMTRHQESSSACLSILCFM